jgi:hypothetical protein
MAEAYGRNAGAMSHPNECPRYDSCSAPLCPLDASWRLRVHRHGDRVCFYLCETVKAGAMRRFEGRADAEVFVAACGMLDHAAFFVSDLRKKLRDAAKKGSRTDKGDRLNAVRHLARAPGTPSA